MSIRSKEEVTELSEDCLKTESACRIGDPTRAAFARGIRAGMRWVLFGSEPYPLDFTPRVAPQVIDGRDFQDGVEG